MHKQRQQSDNPHSIKKTSKSNNTTWKKKLKQQAQQQMLSNHYLSRYQNHMTKMGSQADRSIRQQRKFNNSRSPSARSQSKNTKNFKHAILQKKNAMKNFKKQLKQKGSLSRDKKASYEVFDQIKDSLNQELQSKVPSKIQSGNYFSVQVMSKTVLVNQNTTQGPGQQSYYTYNPYGSQNVSRIESMIVPYTEENIEIKETLEFQEDSFQQYESEKEKADQIAIDQIGSAIKGNFQRRWERSPVKLKLPSPNEKYRASAQSPPIRSERQNKQDSKKNSVSPKRLNSKNDKTRAVRQNERSNKTRSFYSQSSNRSKGNQSQLLKKQKAVNVSSDKKSSSIVSGFPQMGFTGQFDNPLFTDSALIDQDYIQEHQDINMELSRTQRIKDQSSFANDIFLLDENSQRKSLFNSRVIYNFEEGLGTESPIGGTFVDESLKITFPTISDQPPLSLRQSTHDLSTISRFSMTSVQGNQIKYSLCKQINENQFGPYQNALANLRDLIQEYPNAWPIFVVGQRMLQDRKQYQSKRKSQAEQMYNMKEKLQTLKQKVYKSQQQIKNRNRNRIIGDNQLKILALVRKLSEVL